MGPHASHFSSGLLVVFSLSASAERPGVSSGPHAALAEVLGCYFNPGRSHLPVTPFPIPPLSTQFLSFLPMLLIRLVHVSSHFF